MESVSSVRTSKDTSRSAGTASAADATQISSSRVDELYDLAVPPGTKGMPLDRDDLTVGRVARSGWNVLSDELPMPLMVLKAAALENNVAVMAAYCRDQGVLLCPHGKTSMAPQLFRRQIEAGAWGLTAAVPSHLRVYREFGVQRIIYANELVEPAVIKWLARELSADPDFDFYCLVDSVEAVELLDASLRRHGSERPIGVLVEVGHLRGRCGVRTADAAARVAKAVDAADTLDLVGVECFEGLMKEISAVDDLLGFAREVAVDLLRTTSLGERGGLLLSAGGSAFFDRVVDTFVTHWEQQATARVVLRSGCYITQDGGFYGSTSPLGGRSSGPAQLHDAIEIWSTVLSRPEPGLAICSMGRRDAPQDMGMPVPTRVATRDGVVSTLAGATVVALSDQHAHVAVDPSCTLSPGDLVACSISHPCTAFDRWKVIPVVDDDYVISDAVVTVF